MAYSEREQNLINDLRKQLKDDVPEKNILDGQQQHYTDDDLHFYLRRAVQDVNFESPSTRFTLENFPPEFSTLLITGGMIFAFIADGVIQLRNNLAYDDAGLRLDMFNKSDAYDRKASFFLQLYIGDKKNFKRGVLSRSLCGGFQGIASPFHPNWGRYARY